MKNFEMPKMNVSVFSSEDIVTTSTQTVTYKDLAEKALTTTAGVDAGNITVISADDWVNA